MVNTGIQIIYVKGSCPFNFTYATISARVLVTKNIEPKVFLNLEICVDALTSTYLNPKTAPNNKAHTRVSVPK